MNLKLAALALVIAMGGTSTLRAQSCRGCVPEDTTRHLHVLPALGLHVGVPQKASAALGVVVGEDWQRGGRDHSSNAALFVEPGISAGRASLAYVNEGFGSFGSGFGIAATAMRTWNSPWSFASNATYVGGEVLIWPIVFTGPRIGLFRAVSPSTAPTRWLVSFDFGIGL